MQTIKLTKEMRLPQGREDLDKEPLLDKHERWLRRLIANDMAPIYLGDRVTVSDRWASDKGKNPHEGKSGVVRSLEAGIQAAFNVDYLSYGIATDDGEHFETYHYTLDLTHQSEGNSLAEKLLRETNKSFASRYA